MSFVEHANESPALVASSAGEQHSAAHGAAATTTAESLRPLLGPAVAWLALAASATLPAFGADLTAAAAVGLLGAAGALSPQRRWAALATVVLAAILDPVLVPWALAAGFAQELVLGTERAVRIVQARPDGELQQQLSRSRRRGESAALLVATTACLSAAEADEVLRTLRITDAFEARQDGATLEVCIAVDGDALDRDAMEERIAGAAGSSPITFGWASFPDDGVTIEALVDHARGAMGAAAPAAPAEPVRELPKPLHDGAAAAVLVTGASASHV